MILLDTHIWVQMIVDPDELTRNVSAALDREHHLTLAAISLWEVAMLDEYKKIALPWPLK